MTFDILGASYDELKALQSRIEERLTTIKEEKTNAQMTALNNIIQEIQKADLDICVTDYRKLPVGYFFRDHMSFSLVSAD